MLAYLKERVAEEMTFRMHAYKVQKCGAVAAAGAAERFGAHAPDRFHIRSVGLEIGEAEAPGTVGQAPAGHGVRGGRYGQIVVFADEKDGQFPGRGQIEGFHEHALVDRPFTEKSQADRSRPQLLGGQGKPGGHWSGRSNNTRGSRQLLGGKKVHVAALTAA